MSTWILIRGLTRDSHHWGDFPALLSGIAGCRPLALDLPGNGPLHDLPSPTSIAAMAGYCEAAAGRAGARPPYLLVGLSLGAMVAIEWARRNPASIEALVLASTSARPWGRPWERLRPAALPDLAKILIPGRSAWSRERTILALTSARAAIDHDRLAADWGAWRRANPVSLCNTLRQLAAAARYRAPDTPPVGRVLLLAGAGDHLVDPRCTLRLARAWEVPVGIHPWAGHDLSLDDPAWVVTQIADWTAATA